MAPLAHVPQVDQHDIGPRPGTGTVAGRLRAELLLSLTAVDPQIIDPQQLLALGRDVIIGGVADRARLHVSVDACGPAALIAPRAVNDITDTGGRPDGLVNDAVGAGATQDGLGTAVGLELPVIRPSEIYYFERDESAALYDAVEELSGRGARLLVELGMTVGLGPGELYGLHGHRVNWLRGTLTVVDVMTRTGLRQWPKSEKSHRMVPVPPAIMEGMSALMAGRPRDALVFTAPEGGPVDEGNFRDRIWYPSIEKSGCAGSHRR